MNNETERNEAEKPDVNPVALSLTGGFVGTVTGLKRGGVGGAVVGGLIGGTAGYVAGAAADETTPPTADSDVEPISIDVDEADDGEGADGDHQEG